MYQAGEGVEKDQEKATELFGRYSELVRWQIEGVMPLIVALNKAAQGDGKAMWQLGNRYHVGDGVEQDMEKAVEWWQKAHEAGNIGGTHNLGCYHLQEGEVERGIKYLTQSGAAGYSQSYHALGEHYLSHTEEEGNIQKGIGNLTTAAEQGYAPSQWDLVIIYHDGEIVPKDYDKARYWLEDTAKAIDYLKQSASLGYVDALVQLAWHYYWGEGVERDVRLAINLYTSAAEAGSLGAAVKLARSYITGEKGVMAADYDKAINLLQPHLESGLGEVDYLMAYAVRGKCDMKNAYSWEQAVQAFEYMQKAAEEGYVEAMHELAQYYIDGYGVFAEDNEAEKQWLQKYIDNGGTLTDEENTALQSDEEWADYSRNMLVNNIKTIVEANKERIENPLEMIYAEGCLNAMNVMLNAAQLGEANALINLGHWGLNKLKTDPEEAKKYISVACKGGIPAFAYRAGMEWLEDGLDNDTAVENAMEYFGMGAEYGSVDCYLQIGLLCTDKRFEGEKEYEKALKYGKEALQAVADVEDDDYEEQRQQARDRLAEIEQRQKSAWGKIKKGFGSLIGKD